MKILVTGGLGFIGSHTIVELISNDHEVIIVDNLINSKIEVLGNLEKICGSKPLFYNEDITDESKLIQVFENHEIDAVIHFAGLKSVSESIEKPLVYYYNNLVSTMILVKLCLKYGVNKFIFSSSATVYGNNKVPFTETMELLSANNPYGETKSMSERILIDTAKVNPKFSVSIMRYFNPVGAHESGLIGENPKDIPNNLMPFILMVSKGELERLSIFGNDYETIDGTAVRDYIHVVDLAKGHLRVLDKLNEGVHIYNLGTGKGTSVLEIVNAFIEVNGVDIPYEIVDRRPGDIAICYADVSKAEKELHWKAKRDINDMVRDAWNFEQECNLSSLKS